MKVRHCKACRAPLSELDHWCGACGSATPLPREESMPPKRRVSAPRHPLARVRIGAKKKS